MQSRKLYLHEACRDAAIMPISVADRGDHLEMDVSWWNVGTCHAPMPMNIFECIKVKKADLPKWHEIDRNHRCPPPVMKVL